MKFLWIQYLQPYGTHFTAFTFQQSKSRKKCAIYSVKRLIKFQNFEKMTTDEENIFFMCLLDAHTLYSKN